jgi:hypothetical protein
MTLCPHVGLRDASQSTHVEDLLIHTTRTHTNTHTHMQYASPQSLSFSTTTTISNTHACGLKILNFFPRS